MNDILNKESITEIIPQRPPMVMIDNLIVCDENYTETTFYIDGNNVFAKEGYFSEPGLVENIAQTAAARIGYLCKQAKVEVPIGYIAAVKNLQIHFIPPVNTTITTQIKVTHQVLDITVINGTVTVDDKLAAECEMKIFAKRISA
jgi:3-hydroxymyristoyl/3-hydroxydecanoyl-(acyl carrier protein) dehydratase